METRRPTLDGCKRTLQERRTQPQVLTGTYGRTNVIERETNVRRTLVHAPPDQYLCITYWILMFDIAYNFTFMFDLMHIHVLTN